MTYLTEHFTNAVVEEYVTGRVLRIKVGSDVFKFYAHSVDEHDIAIYIGHGSLNFRVKHAIRLWARKRGVKVVRWGDGRALTINAKVC